MSSLATAASEGDRTLPDERREARAEAKAETEKARQKAMRPWYKKKRFLIPLIILAIAVIAVASGGDEEPGDGGEPVAGSEDLPEEVPEDASEAGMNEPATDGQFTFTATGFECGETVIGEEPFEEEAQGQFCMLDVTVENTGNEARSLSASDQYLYDDQDRRFSSDLSYAFAIETPIYEEINPGNSIEGTIVFDVPEDANIVLAELHDSPFSGGVVVRLD